MLVYQLNNKPSLNKDFNVACICKGDSNSQACGLTSEELLYFKRKKESKKTVIPVYRGNTVKFIVVPNEKDEQLNDYRNLGSDLAKQVHVEKLSSIDFDTSVISKEQTIALVEGFVLESYQFLKYFKKEDREEKQHTIEKLNLYHQELTKDDITFINNLLKAVYWTRNLVNEPVNFLNATRFSKEVLAVGKIVGLNVEVFDKKRIESLKMGGLLAVNKGSIDPPTFTVCEWKPENAINSKPYILVGKGVMYDTGGLSLKPTANSMDYMKSDMGGAATVAGTLYSLALNKLPVWVIGLIPATDNRLDANAYAPGDIIQMYNGLYVEVMNTDAEGRLIIADGLSYGDKFDPELIMTVATLTGNAALAIGSQGAVFMGNAEEKHFNNFAQAADVTHERLVKFPFWNEFGESLKSNMADLKNLGSREGGAISAGKFLENFTKSPYIHFDIAGPAFISTAEKYKPKGATGYGVRLFTEFFRKLDV